MIYNRIVMWGAGNSLRYILEYLPEEYSNRIVSIIDSDKKKWGKIINDKYAIDEPSAIYRVEYDAICITIIDENIRELLKEEIKKYGITKPIIDVRDFIISKDFKNESCKDINRIYDCFTFYNEFELLELRLKLLYDTVDYFVIAEMEKNHQAARKPLLLKQNWNLIKEFENKIIYIGIEEKEIPSLGKIIHNNHDWTLENFQRNMLMEGIKNCVPNDVIIISDLDEIPDSKVVSGIRTGKHDFIKNSPILLENDVYMGYFNFKALKKWHGSVITLYGNLTEIQIFRDFRGYYSKIKQAGWHFTWMGGEKRIIEKCRSICEGDGISDEMVKRYRHGESITMNCDGMLVDVTEKDIPFIEILRNDYPKWFYVQN